MVQRTEANHKMVTLATNVISYLHSTRHYYKMIPLLRQLQEHKVCEINIGAHIYVCYVTSLLWICLPISAHVNFYDIANL